MATYSFHWLIMGKSGKWQVLPSHCRYLDFFLQKCLLSSPLWFIWILSKSLNLIGCHGNIKGKFSKKYSKIFSSEAVWGIKLKLCRIVSNNNLYKNIFFIAVAKALWLLWQLKVSIDLQWEKRKLRFIAISLQIFWQKFYRNVPGVVLYKPYEICPNCWFWLVAMATEMLNFRRKYSKIFFSEVIRGWSWNFA